MRMVFTVITIDAFVSFAVVLHLFCLTSKVDDPRDGISEIVWFVTS